MYVAKFVFDASKALVGRLAIKHKVLLHCYPVGVFRSKRQIRVSFAMIVNNPGASGFVKELKSCKGVVNLSHKRNFVLGQLKESCRYVDIYNPDIMHIRPWVIDGEKGTETMVVASWKNEHLQRIADAIKPKHLGVMVEKKRCQMSDIFMINLLPKMTSKQRRALELALKKGYYSYPRKTSVKKLSRAEGVSYSTFQAHLRKAENKIIPFLCGEEYRE